MPYISTEYDYDLKTEVLKINGDKGYTHTTDTILKELTNETTRNTTKIEYFTANFTVDVARDIADSKVVIYDNNEAIPIYVDGDPLAMIDWTSSTTQKTFTLKLGYDVDHNIYARYLGNNKGLPSKSQILTLNEPMPSLYTSTITRTTNTVQFDKNTSISIPIQFTTGSRLESTESKQLDLVVDGTTVTQANVVINSNSNNGTTTFALPNGLDAGLHHILIKFDGDTHNESTSLEFDISVGYNVEITDHSKLFSIAESSGVVGMVYQSYDVNYVTCYVSDWFNQPLEGVDVTTTPSSSIDTTDANGMATINSTFNNCTGTIACKITQNNKTYTSESVSIPVIRVSNIQFGVEKVIAEGYSANMWASIREYEWVANAQSTLESVPIIFQNRSETRLDNTVAKIVYTNDEGVANIPYVGAGLGERPFTVRCGYSEKTSTVDDVTQYWSTNTPSLNKNNTVISRNFYELTNGFKLENMGAGTMAIVGLNKGELLNDEWRITFDVISASKNIKLVTGWWEDETKKTIGDMVMMTNAVNFQADDTVTLQYVNGEISIASSRGNVSGVGASQVSKGYPFIGIFSEIAGTEVTGSALKVKSQLTFTNLKFRRV